MSWIPRATRTSRRSWYENTSSSFDSSIAAARTRCARSPAFIAVAATRAWTSAILVFLRGWTARSYSESPPARSALTRRTASISSRSVPTRSRILAGTMRMANPHEQVVVFFERSTPFARWQRGQTTTPNITSHHEHEAREAGAVVVHGDAELLDLVLDLSELDPPELRHLPHLPLEHFSEGPARAVHVPLRDVPSGSVVSESERDSRADHLALAPALLREDAVRDRAHGELPHLDLADLHREDGGNVHEVLLGEARIRKGRIERIQVGYLGDCPPGRDEEPRWDRQHRE